MQKQEKGKRPNAFYKNSKKYESVGYVWFFFFLNLANLQHHFVYKNPTALFILLKYFVFSLLKAEENNFFARILLL